MRRRKPKEPEETTSVRVNLPTALVERFDWMWREKARVNRAYRRAGMSYEAKRINRTTEIGSLMEEAVEDFERERREHGEPELPEPRPVGRPRKEPEPS